MKNTFRAGLTLAVIMAGFQAALAQDVAARPRGRAAPYVHRVPLAHFITRQGERLMDGDQEFRFIGANMPGLVLPYDWTLYLPERMHLPTPWEQEDGFKTLDQMNLRVVRLWNLPIRDPKDKPADGRMTWHYVQGPGQFNEASFKVVDSLFALANKYGVRAIALRTLDQALDGGQQQGQPDRRAHHHGENNVAGDEPAQHESHAGDHARGARQAHDQETSRLADRRVGSLTEK